MLTKIDVIVLYLAELSELFGPFGTVLEASVIKDYGFVVNTC